MRRRDVLALLAAAALPVALPRAGRAGGARPGGRLHRRNLFLAAKVPALVIGAVRKGQTSIQGFGRRADGAAEEPAADTLFRIGSITKPLPGSFGEPCQRRHVSFADPLTKYVPDFTASLSEFCAADPAGRSGHPFGGTAAGGPPCAGRRTILLPPSPGRRSSPG